MSRIVGRWAKRLGLWSLAALLVTLPLWRHRVLHHRMPEPVFFEFHDLVLYTNDLFWLIALAGWLVGTRLGRTRPWRLGPRWLFALLAALVLWSWISAGLAVDRTYSVYQSLRLTMLLALYLAVINAPIAPSRVAGAMAVGAVLQAAVGLPQFVLGHWLGLARLGEVPLDADWPGVSVVMVGDMRWLRAYGLTQHPNLLGGLLAAYGLLVASEYLRRTGRKLGPWLVAVLLALAALLATFSRSAWLGTAIGAAVVALLLRRVPLSRRALLGLATGAAIVVAVFAVTCWPLLVARLGVTGQGVEIRSLEERGSLVAGALALIRWRPVTGVGPGNFSTAIYRYARDAVADYPIYQPVHNVPLLAAAELGLPGCALWLALAVAPWVALWRRRQSQMTLWLAGLSGALAVLGTVSWLDAYPWAAHQGRLLQWLLWGLWAKELVRDTSSCHSAVPLPSLEAGL